MIQFVVELFGNINCLSDEIRHGIFNFCEELDQNCN